MKRLFGLSNWVRALSENSEACKRVVRPERSAFDEYMDARIKQIVIEKRARKTHNRVNKRRASYLK